MSAERQNCEATGDSRCSGTALQTHSLLGNGSVANTQWPQQARTQQYKSC
jgi:hypothetical protein